MHRNQIDNKSKTLNEEKNQKTDVDFSDLLIESRLVGSFANDRGLDHGQSERNRDSEQGGVSKRAVSLIEAERWKNAARPFALKEKLLRCFREVFFVCFLAIGANRTG